MRRNIIHPCKFGKDCNNVQLRYHFERYVHECPNGLNCVVDDEEHMTHYYYPLKMTFCDKMGQMQ